MFGFLSLYVFCCEVQKKKSAALLSGAYRLVQAYRPRFLQSLINVYAVYLGDIPWFLHVFTAPLPNP